MLIDYAPVTQSLQGIPEGKDGIIATLKAMRSFVRKDKTSLVVRLRVLRIVRKLVGKDWTGEARAVHEWVRDNIRFVRDITDVELIHDAERVLQFGQGDCDDKSILFCSLLESIGHPTRFVAIGFAPDEYSHVYSETLLGKTWVASDTTENVPFGWEPPSPVSKLIIHN